MDMETAISENYNLYSISETMANIEAGEFGDDILSSKFKAFISSLDIDRYGALLNLSSVANNENDVDKWLGLVQQFTNSLSDEQKALLNRI